MASRSIAKADRLTPRAVIRIAGMAGALIVCIIPHGLWRMVRAHSPWPPRFLGLCARAAGVRVAIAGEPIRHNVLFTSNHLSWLEILALGGAGRTAFVAKAEVGRWGIIGWLAGLNHTVYVEREDRKAVKGQANALRDALLRRKPVTLFPEGTTGDGVALLPFRASLFAAVAPPPEGVRVQPIALDYGDFAAEIAWTDAEPADANVKRILNRKGTIRLTIHFLEPLPHDVLSDRKAIALMAQSQIASRLDAASRERRLGL
ncbi:1-acyl-sn-glycerol-3-phosphate acyltransferase [Sphingomonas sp. LaA6.9]|uniref:lysophospholipid acyltransferase family protein n=1 Tax=Sphingomonas sp. LaA6.9 TaxID=2919914 RepID=UPI001F502E7C|nr:lysophospholipid acyltransferase family protein [Sphingomonas sp. LaA6.9]MCJ8159469.1 1-acyl-sn-glycerol-3-phosphate acyltransferase [Sphingomonas sp. LaA6.9]